MNGMHPQARHPPGMHPRQQQQYSDMGHGNPAMMMGGQHPGQGSALGMRRSASHMNGGGGMHVEEPPSKRYRKVISSVSLPSPCRLGG